MTIKVLKHHDSQADDSDNISEFLNLHVGYNDNISSDSSGYSLSVLAKSQKITPRNGAPPNVVASPAIPNLMSKITSQVKQKI